MLSLNKQKYKTSSVPEKVETQEIRDEHQHRLCELHGIINSPTIYETEDKSLMPFGENENQESLKFMKGWTGCRI